MPGSVVPLAMFSFKSQTLRLLLTHWLCRMFGDFYGELWKLQGKEIQVLQLVDATQRHYYKRHYYKSASN